MNNPRDLTDVRCNCQSGMMPSIYLTKPFFGMLVHYLQGLRLMVAKLTRKGADNIAVN